MIHTMAQARNANEQAGYHFFEPATVRFFGSRLPQTVIPVPNGALFVTSEQRPAGYGEPVQPRLFTIRFIHDNGRTETIGAFQGWQTREGATRIARRMAAAWTADAYFATYTNRNGGTFPVVVIDEPTSGVVRFFDTCDKSVTVLDGGTVNLSNINRMDV
jgi:hypothetical protein